MLLTATYALHAIDCNIFWNTQRIWFHFREFSFQLIYFCVINKWITVASIIIQASTKFSFRSCKLMEYLDSTFIVVSFNSWVEPLPRTKISFFISNMHWLTIVFSKNKTFFFPIRTWKLKKWTRIKSNTIPRIEYLFRPEFLVNLINKLLD